MARRRVGLELPRMDRGELVWLLAMFGVAVVGAWWVLLLLSDADTYWPDGGSSPDLDGLAEVIDLDDYRQAA